MEENLYPDPPNTQRPNTNNRSPHPHRYLYVPWRWRYILLPLVIVLLLGITSVTFFMYRSSIHTQSNSNTHLAKIPTATPAKHAKTPNSFIQSPTPNTTPTTSNQVPAPNTIPNSPNQAPTSTPTRVPPTQAPAPTPTPSTAPSFRPSGSYSKWWATTFCCATGYIGSTQVGTLYAGTNYMFCKAWAGEVRDSKGQYNHWWLWTDLDTGGKGWVSAYYLKNWGNDVAKDDSGNVIPDC